jgi:hypothetical protein
MKAVRTMSLVALSFLAFAPASAYAQFGPMESDVQSAIEVYAELTLEQSVVDLGTISDEEPKTVKVGFKNSGTGTLTITDLKGSCGCTVPQLAKKDYKPGEGGVIEITFNPHGKRDAQHTTVTIMSNDRVKSNATVAINSIVRPNVMWDPQVVAFNQVGKGKGGKQILTITSRLENFNITEVTTTNPAAFEAKVLETKAETLPDGKPGFVSKVEVTLKPETPVGMAQANMTLRTTNAKTPLINVSTFAEVTGDLVTTPVKFFLNQLNAEQDLATGVSNKVILRHRENKPFKILKAEVVRMVNGLEHTFTCEVKPEDEAGTSYAITLLGKAPASATAAPVQGDVVITTDIAGEENVKIGYFGMVAAKAGVAPAQPAPGAAATFKADPRGGNAVLAKPQEPVKK